MQRNRATCIINLSDVASLLCSCSRPYSHDVSVFYWLQFSSGPGLYSTLCPCLTSLIGPVIFFLRTLGANYNESEPILTTIKLRSFIHSYNIKSGPLRISCTRPKSTLANSVFVESQFQLKLGDRYSVLVNK